MWVIACQARSDCKVQMQIISFVEAITGPRLSYSYVGSITLVDTYERVCFHSRAFFFAIYRFQAFGCASLKPPEFRGC